MKTSWQTAVAFWTATFVSCLWLAVIAVGSAFVGIRTFIAQGGFNPTGHEPLEILIVALLALQPLVILALVIRAIRLRNVGRPMLKIARALYPLMFIALFVPLVRGLRYLSAESEMRRIERSWGVGTITYLCSTHSTTADYSPRTTGPITLRLTEIRHLGKLGTWFVSWPGKRPIEAVSFPARTGSEGGSQGIKWREPDGQLTTAVLSFSDVMTEHGPGSIWVLVAQGDVPVKDFVPVAQAISSTSYTCGPDPASYRE